MQLVEGWTGVIRAQLLSAGVAQPLTGMTVSIVATSVRLTPVTLAGTLTVEDADNGIVAFAPSAGDLLANDSPLQIRWKVTDSNGKVVFFPNANPMVWQIAPH